MLITNALAIVWLLNKQVGVLSLISELLNCSAEIWTIFICHTYLSRYSLLYDSLLSYFCDSVTDVFQNKTSRRMKTGTNRYFTVIYLSIPFV